MFVSKNWTIGLSDGCKPPYNFLELIDKELKEFEGSFEHDEIVDI
jgi:hypothetical protein